MKVIDLHPEELLEKNERGALTELERTRLDAHLARCGTCRFEQLVRADFEDELVPKLVAAPLPLPPLAPVVSPDGHPGVLPIRTRPARRMWMLAVAAVLVGSVAGAGPTWRALVSVEAPESAPLPALVEIAPVVSAPLPRFVTARAASSEPPQARIDEAPVASVVTPPHVTATPLPTPLRVNAARPPVVDDAAPMFEEANAARRRGDHVRALELYRELEAQHPRSREAHVALATSGQLLLDRGDPDGALRALDAYQARGAGDLDEEVMAARAIALERLGRAGEARGAWRALLAAFPASPYASRMHARAEASPR